MDRVSFHPSKSILWDAAKNIVQQEQYENAYAAYTVSLMRRQAHMIRLDLHCRLQLLKGNAAALLYFHVDGNTDTLLDLQV